MAWGILLLAVLHEIKKKKHYVEIYHLFHLDRGQAGLLILRGLCCPVPNAGADHLGTEVMLPP